ncbi:MAG: hypothetical protein L3J69_18455 [Desulfobacula sp.]|nr:hypothetical protein [Desulfobacula sp.]
MKPHLPYFSISILLLLVILLAPAIGLVQDFYNRNFKIQAIPNPLYEISNGWEYHWGDPKTDMVPDNEWKAIKYPANPPQRNGHNILWLRNKTPYKKFKVPTLLIDGKGVLLTFEAFLGNRMIYKFGKLTPTGQGNISGISSHLIDLGNDFQGKTLTFRVFSDYSNIGIRGKVILGSKSDLIMSIIKKDIHRSLLGFFMIFIGIIELFTFKESIKETGSVSMFGILAVSLGLYIVSLTTLKDLIFYAPVFWFNLYIVSMTLIPVGAMGFIWQTFRPEQNNYLHKIWRFHIGYALVCQASFILALSSLLPLSAGTLMLNILRWLLILEMLLMVGIAFKDSLIKDNRRARIYLCGFLPIMFAGTHDALVGLGKLDSPVSYVPWTLMLFIISLEFIQRLINIKVQKKLRLYSEELERKSKEKTQLIRDLHDGIGGLITNIKFLSEMGLKSQTQNDKDKTLSHISELSSESLIEVGNFMQSLDEKDIDWETILMHFAHLANNIIKPLGLSFDIQDKIDENANKPDRILFLNLLRIYREALTNITKHSKATYVIIRLEVDLKQILLSIQDNGIGFGSDMIKGLGIDSMRARATKLGGKLTIDSNKGTCILLKI